MTHGTRTTLPVWLSGAVTRLYGAVLSAFGRKPEEKTQAVDADKDLCLAAPLQRARHYQESGLPAALLQTFGDEPLAAGDSRFVGREQPMQRLRAAVEAWRAGRSPMLVVTGPQGCGITTLLRNIPGELVAQEAFRYDSLERRPSDAKDALALLSEVAGCTQPCASIDDLVQHLNGLPAQVLVIDNGHFLVNRIMGAHRAVSVFGAVMVATRSRHLWILGCQEHAWRRLMYVYRAERYFSEAVELKFFNEAELGQCLHARLQAAGIRPTDATAGQQPTLPETVEDQVSTLYRLSNGKCDLAFFYLLRSLRVAPESGRFDTQPIVELDFSVLKNLVGDEMFTLAELAAHGQLSVAEHCAIFRTSHDESWLLLERLYHQCIVDKNQAGGDSTYRIAPLFSGLTCRLLSTANVLY